MCTQDRLRRERLNSRANKAQDAALGRDRPRLSPDAMHAFPNVTDGQESEDGNRNGKRNQIMDLLEQRSALTVPEIHFTDEEQTAFTGTRGRFTPPYRPSGSPALHNHTPVA
ncbi:hypothetical protein [Novosphingobium mangrovi (ex Huang et al. 2023)]|uniref:Uncharacterized protein n=1 Tax=Novosphingobium mangrovi (ex Huang et al. 2023) TaxID=2976432 RepID=A0ABT2I9B4_9SPHN|nr:hypothetical protein [Novosphingobium mangrovi (ex Huang et al. 2023)]MCT2401432.1 hypothetical protein [Novosphingobium mangrovi (ex Huang et al. 2023)]